MASEDLSLNKSLVLIYKFKTHESTQMKQTPSHDLFNESIFQILQAMQPEKVVEVGCMRGTLARV